MDFRVGIVSWIVELYEESQTTNHEPQITNKIMNLLQKISNKLNEKIIRQNAELEWAHIYHDSIRGKKWLDDLPLNIGRWAGNYAFFYVLNRILNDYKPKKIVEFGLGESSKFISTYIENFLTDSTQLIIEHDSKWINNFKTNFSLSERSTIEIHDLSKINIKGKDTSIYKNIEKSINSAFDLYIVDGPFGNRYYSRYNIVDLAASFNKTHDFIIIFDDVHRKGDLQSFLELKNSLNQNGFKIYSKIYSGNKDLGVIATEQYRFVSSL